jgi:hypothetical protein
LGLVHRSVAAGVLGAVAFGADHRSLPAWNPSNGQSQLFGLERRTWSTVFTDLRHRWRRWDLAASARAAGCARRG